uniref:Acylphosphatase-like domain-containing protein n=1 Tax=Craspedostauros australis TaxID=1486917 RepID=A0A7R9ZP10_9STRA|mmetsp:Transcript_21105/g.58706  ORF Transcript_21105/g.58706 Transcript_21105/m.58706 type:complete len:157 (+) Transcript_21105:192-662(+)
MMPRYSYFASVALCLLIGVTSVQAFGVAPSTTSIAARQTAAPSSSLFAEADKNGSQQPELIARRIILKGDVNGGYYRACVLNEAGKFRRLLGTMTPPDDTDTAEILVEGKRKMVEGFIRWCERGNVGLSQTATVEGIIEEEVTGLYDGFYCKTKQE